MKRLVKVPRKNGVPFWGFSAVKRALDQMTKKLGHFPAEAELLRHRRGELLEVMRAYHGDYVDVRTRLGYGFATIESIARHANALGGVLRALRFSFPTLTSDQFWSAIKSRWTEKELTAAVQRFEKSSDIGAFSLLFS